MNVVNTHTCYHNGEVILNSQHIADVRLSLTIAQWYISQIYVLLFFLD